MRESPNTNGLFLGVEAADYHAWKALSVSRSKTAERSLLHMRYAETHPTEQTRTMFLGTATHTAILEPDSFESRYAMSPKWDMRTKKGKEAAAEFELEHEGMERLTEDEWGLVCGMRDAVWDHPIAREILSGKGINEASAIWTDEISGLRCKARPDRITDFDGYHHVVDLKTTKDASAEAFSRQVASLKYYWSAAHYLDGLYTIKPASRFYTYLAVENTPPHGVAIYTQDENDIDQGRAEMEKIRLAIAAAMRENHWPGYPAEITEIRLPGWAQRYPE